MVMNVLKQRRWTDEELIKEGFKRYERKKTVVLARELRPGEAPKRIKTAWDTLVAHVGFMICYDVSDGKKRASLDSYNHWPVDPGIFLKTFHLFKINLPQVISHGFRNVFGKLLENKSMVRVNK